MNHQNISSQIFIPVRTLPNVLQQPRLREEVLQQIYADPNTAYMFNCLKTQEQQDLLEFCMGNRGLKITYDPFFHDIFDPLAHPERLNCLLTNILKQRIVVKQVLPREGIRLSENASLMIMDILVELENGSLVNVEIQKTGYDFPMQRSFCYGADLLVRQYSKLRDSLSDNFTYKDMRPVYLIVLMESSPAIFSKFPNTYIHHSEFRFDSGLSLGNLLNFIYIPLDIFCKMPHNELTELEAWMYFLGSDDPFHIQRVIEKYPFFKQLYEDIIEYRYHPKELIVMFSKALAIMDHNTINLMIDELKQEIEQKNAALSQKDAEIAHLKALLEENQIQTHTKDI